eukprot:gene2166-2031_t
MKALLALTVLFLLVSFAVSVPVPCVASAQASVLNIGDFGGYCGLQPGEKGCFHTCSYGKNMKIIFESKEVNSFDAVGQVYLECLSEGPLCQCSRFISLLASAGQTRQKRNLEGVITSTCRTSEFFRNPSVTAPPLIFGHPSPKKPKSVSGVVRNLRKFSKRVVRKPSSFGTLSEEQEETSTLDFQLEDTE